MNRLVGLLGNGVLEIEVIFPEGEGTSTACFIVSKDTTSAGVILADFPVVIGSVEGNECIGFQSVIYEMRIMMVNDDDGQ